MIELLAPGGSFEGLKAAVNAGADAIYMGGQRFGARAYAQNPDETDLMAAMDYCHIHGRKLYLTVNTLLKEEELKRELYQYLLPYYEHGLDAVLVQDFGVFSFIKENFPGLPLHASTQMTIMGVNGARLLKQMGAERIVPSRELTLKEIEQIHSQVDIEIECFVHGALCYCYSGQCLMSSMIGGRSGNRGRCAQPCRLPYDLYRDGERLNQENGRYLLSLKDICTLEHLPDLMEAGVCSFKIEGRMKRAEYAAGVTEVYRKYVDLYREKGRAAYRVDPEDEKILMDLYNRGGFSRGYYQMYNGKSMMTMERPNHWGTSGAKVLSANGGELRLRALEDLWSGDALELAADAGAGAGNTGRELILKENVPEGREFTVKVPEPGRALNRNLSNERKILNEKKILKEKKNLKEKKTLNQPVGKRGMTGSGTLGRKGVAGKLPSIARNAVLARVRCEHLLQNLQEKYGKSQIQEKIKGKFILQNGKEAILTVRWQEKEVTVTGEIPTPAQNRPLEEDTVSRQLRKTGNTPFAFDTLEICLEDGLFYPMQSLNEVRRRALEELEAEILAEYRRETPVFAGKKAERDTKAQASGASETKIDSEKQEIGTEESLRLTVSVETPEQLEAVMEEPGIHGVYVDCCMFLGGSGAAVKALDFVDTVNRLHQNGKKCFLMLPAVWRERGIRSFEQVFGRSSEFGQPSGNALLEAADGFVLRCNEQLEYLHAFAGRKEMIAGAELYTYNREARQFLSDWGITMDTLPVENNFRELLARGCQGSECIVYGYLPLMVTAQCLVKNTAGCRQRPEFLMLKDRKNARFPVKNMCPVCTNVIYNSVPLDLISCGREITELHPSSCRLAFTIEDGQEVHRILTGARAVFLEGRKVEKIVSEGTRGHFKRGVE